MKAALLFLALGGCDFTYETLAGGEYATVYVCDSGAMCTGGEEEWCWDGSKAELEELLGAKCHSISLDERIGPAVLGCGYSCEPHSGCNAHCGCFCEAP